MPYRGNEQDVKEFEWLLESIRGATSILEIGSAYGHSLLAMAEVAAPKAILRSIDFGYFANVPQVRCDKELKGAIHELNAAGFDAAVFFGNSHTAEALEWAKQWAPYDLVFIDASPAYEEVRQDWRDYGVLGKLVALHDIGGIEAGPQRLWQEIKRESGFRTSEIRYTAMGIGIVLRELPLPQQPQAQRSNEATWGVPQPDWHREQAHLNAPMQEPAPEPRPPDAPAAVGGASGAQGNQSIEEVLENLRRQGYNILEPNAQGSPQR